MNRWVVAGGAVGVGALAVLATSPGKPKGETVPNAPQPMWSSLLRAKVRVRFNLSPVPPATQVNVPAGAVAHLKELRRNFGTMTVDGEKIPKVSLDGIATAALEWATMIASSGAVVTDGGRRWVEATAPGYVMAARLAGELVDPPTILKFRRELAELASYLDKSDDTVNATPDNRTYWDFAWARAKGLPTPAKIFLLPAYGPFWMAGKAWEAAPDVLTTIAKDVLGPSAKFIVTTFGTFLFIGGVGLYVYKKWPGG